MDKSKSAILIRCIKWRNCYGEHGGEKNPISLRDKNNTYLNNAHRYIFTRSCPRHTSHTKQDSLELQLDVSRKNPPLIPRQPWECTGSGGKRGWINWRHQARQRDYSGLVFKAVTGLRSIPSPRVALCLSWVTAIQRGHLWLSSTELPAWNWASLQASAAAHRALSKFHCFHFFLVIFI